MIGWIERSWKWSCGFVRFSFWSLFFGIKQWFNLEGDNRSRRFGAHGTVQCPEDIYPRLAGWNVCVLFGRSGWRMRLAMTFKHV